jgi:type IV pilus assembly protein PilV
MEFVSRNNVSGFTLIEFLVAIVILMVGLMGLLQAVNYTISHTMTTQLRDEAVRVADEKMAMEKSSVFDAIATGSSAKTEGIVRVNVMNAFKNYSVVREADFLSGSANTKAIQVEVVWRYKGVRYSHVISSLVSKSVH